MKRIEIQLDCGETTCAPVPGQFCAFVATRKFGAIYYCKIWHCVDSRGRAVGLEEKDGWLQRCPECLAAELITR